MKNIEYNRVYRMSTIPIKLFLSIILFGSMYGSVFAQNDTIPASNEIIDTSEMRVFVDSTIMELKNKILIFVEYEDGMVIDRIDLRTGEKKTIMDFDEDKWDDKKDSTKFRGHWSGFELGLNNFVNNNNDFQRPAGYEYTDLKPWKSWNFNLNFAQWSNPIIKKNLGIIGGLGLEWNQYTFLNDNNIQVNSITGEIEERIFVSDYEVKKSKLNTTYLTTPILLEAQLGKGNSKDKFYISAGVIGGLRLSSVMKVKHELNGKKQKIKERGNDYNTNKWRWGLTARLGYKDYFNFYATYYVTPFFEKGKGPELYPVSAGISMTFD